MRLPPASQCRARLSSANEQKKNFIETILFYIFRFSSITFIMRLLFFFPLPQSIESTACSLISVHYINIHIRVVIRSRRRRSVGESMCFTVLRLIRDRSSMITLNSASTIIIIIDVGEGGVGGVHHIDSMESAKGQSRHNHIVSCRRDGS